MPERRFHKGQTVEFRLGTRSVTGTISEDRGAIGVGGRRLYRVEFRAEPQAPNLSFIELPADQLTAVRATTGAR